jgi:uncharacterized protein
MFPRDPLQGLRKLHAEVDRRAGALSERHADRLRCGLGCTDCCVDGLTVFEVEAERIRREAPEVLATEPNTAGGCAFLSPEGACRIYAQRPYVCRTQGLPLRWLEERDEGIVELRDICPLNEEGEEQIENLVDNDCWSIGPVEEALAALQRAYGAGSLRRTALRSLFANPDEPERVQPDGG